MKPGSEPDAGAPDSSGQSPSDEPSSKLEDSEPSRSKLLANIVRSFTQNEDGVVTVEFLAWIPAFALMLALITDLSFVFLTNSSMWDVARDAARRLALHKMTASEAEDFVLENLFTISRNFDVEAIEGDDAVVVLVSTPIDDATAFQVYNNLLPGELVARVIMLREPE